MTQTGEHVLTLITHPQTLSLTSQLAERVEQAVGAKHLYWLDDKIAADIPLPKDIHKTAAYELARSAIGHEQVDIVVQESASRRKKILIADMDSTMIDQECIDELADELGLKQKVAAITARAMNGEIEFSAALHERVALLAGLPLEKITQVYEQKITLASGGRTLLATMKAHGAYTALVSGGFTHFTSKVANALGFDEHRANQLLENENELSGKVAEPILGAAAKVEAMDDIVARLGITHKDVIAVGDGANDLPMLQKAGTGVALHAKPSVAAQSDVKINYGDLTALLYIQGYRKHDFTVE